MPGTGSRASSSFCDESYSVVLSGETREIWYKLLVTCPPIWMVGGFCRYTFMPGMPETLGRRSSMIWFTSSLRWLRGFRRTTISP